MSLLTTLQRIRLDLEEQRCEQALAVLNSLLQNDLQILEQEEHALRHRCPEETPFDPHTHVTLRIAAARENLQCAVRDSADPIRSSWARTAAVDLLKATESWLSSAAQ